MTDIPKAREIIAGVAKQLAAEGRFLAAEDLQCALSMMTRQQPKKRAQNTKKCGVDIKRQIAAYCAQHPHMHQDDVAFIFGVNPGRVSEAIKKFGQ